MGRRACQAKRAPHEPPKWLTPVTLVQPTKPARLERHTNLEQAEELLGKRLIASEHDSSTASTAPLRRCGGLSRSRGWQRVMLIRHRGA